MPTVNIPDKICPHCGGTKWYFYAGYPRTCFNKLSERQKAWRATDKGKEFTNSYYKTEAGKKHRDKYLNKESTMKLRAELARQKYYRDKAINPDKVRASRKVKAAKERSKLTDSVVKRYAARDYNGISYSEVTPELIELTRTNILLKRVLRNEKRQEKHPDC